MPPPIVPGYNPDGSKNWDSPIWRDHPDNPMKAAGQEETQEMAKIEDQEPTPIEEITPEESREMEELSEQLANQGQDQEPEPGTSNTSDAENQEQKSVAPDLEEPWKHGHEPPTPDYPIKSRMYEIAASARKGKSLLPKQAYNLSYDEDGNPTGPKPPWEFSKPANTHYERKTQLGAGLDPWLDSPDQMSSPLPSTITNRPTPFADLVKKEFGVDPVDGLNVDVPGPKPILFPNPSTADGLQPIELKLDDLESAMEMIRKDQDIHDFVLKHGLDRLMTVDETGATVPLLSLTPKKLKETIDTLTIISQTPPDQELPEGIEPPTIWRQPPAYPENSTPVHLRDLERTQQELRTQRDLHNIDAPMSREDVLKSLTEIPEPDPDAPAQKPNLETHKVVRTPLRTSFLPLSPLNQGHLPLKNRLWKACTQEEAETACRSISDTFYPVRVALASLISLASHLDVSESPVDIIISGLLASRAMYLLEQAVEDSDLTNWFDTESTPESIKPENWLRTLFAAYIVFQHRLNLYLESLDLIPQTHSVSTSDFWEDYFGHPEPGLYDKVKDLKDLIEPKDPPKE